MKRIKKYLIKALVDLRASRVSRVYEKEISKIKLDNNYQLDQKIIKDHQLKWSRIYKKKVNPRWLLWYSQGTGKISADYVPENIYYTIIEPVLNNKEFQKSYSDKNFFDLFYPQGIFPETIIRNIDGYFFNKNYTPLNLNNDKSLFNFLDGIDQFVIKPSLESGGGNNVKFFSLKENKYINSEGHLLTFKTMQQLFKKNYILQKIIQQHEFFSQLNESSLNTLKVFTYRSVISNHIEILHSILRVGAKGERVDNFRAGGYSIGIDASGKLNNYACTKDGKKFEKVNEINLESNQLMIPFFESIKQTAVAIASKNIYHRLLGLDMTIDYENKICCLEVNNDFNEINFFQFNNGSLFGEFTEEIIEYCINNRNKLYNYYLL